MDVSFYQDKRIEKKDIPEDVLFILQKLKDSGFQSFLVGGCVRDLLLKRVVRDWDMITDARPEQIKLLFKEHKTLMIGRSFHTVTLVLNQEAYQVSTFCYKKSEKTVYETKDKHDYLLINDLFHRDFTINAMAWNEKKGLMDPVNGLRDLRQKVLRSTHPNARFREDALRMLRAIRIACELSFCISPEIKTSIIKQAFFITYMSPERIRDEIYWILKSPDASRGMSLLQLYGLEQYIFRIDQVKKILLPQKGRIKKSLSIFDVFKDDLTAQLALWGRFYFGSCQIACIFFSPVIKKLRFSKKITDNIKILLSREWEDIDFSSSQKIRFLMAQFGRENTQLIALLKKIILLSENKVEEINQLSTAEELLKEELKMNHPVKLEELAINGDDLIKLGISEGKKIGNILNTVLEIVLINPDRNKKDYLLKFVQDII